MVIQLSLSLSRFPRSQRGFTLIEIAIVLVIIGLLIGGVLVAQSLISATRLNAQVRQLQQFDIATRNFIAQYKTLPGENPNFNAAFKASAGYITQDMTIKSWSDYAGGSYAIESYSFFPDLSESGMIIDSYTTSDYPYVLDSGIGHPYPQPAYYSKKTMISGWGTNTVSMIGVIGNSSGDIYWTIDQGFLNLALGSRWGPGDSTSFPGTAPLSPIQALALDTKIDDGLPRTGDVLAFGGNAFHWGSAAPDPKVPIEIQDGTVKVLCPNAAGKYSSSNEVDPAFKDSACGLLIHARNLN